MAGRKRAMVKYYLLILSPSDAGPLSIILRVRMSWRARLMTRPYLRFLNACLMAEMMQPQPWLQKGVCEWISYSKKFMTLILI